MSGIYEELGVRPVLNAQGNRTLLGGGTPSPAVRALMDESEEYFFVMNELQDAVGERIADMLGVEAALVTSGCSAALAMAAAGCMTGQDPDKVDQIPDTTGMPNEIIIQKRLRVKYDRCMTIPGAKLIEVGDAEETRPEHIEAAIGPNTAAIHYLVIPGGQPGAVSLEEVIGIGHSHGIPIIVDAAGRVYPTEDLSRFVKMGADLVAYGAKYFGSVNSTGLLTGKKDLVEAAKMNSFVSFEATPRRAFGRPMKVDRQEVIAVYGALREWLTMNHEDRFASYEPRIAALRADLSGIAGIELGDSTVHGTGPGGPVGGLRIKVDAEKVGKTAEDVIEELRAGNPGIWVREMVEDDAFGVVMLTLKEGGEKVIAERLKEIL